MSKKTSVSGFVHEDRIENPNAPDFPEIEIEFSYDMPDKYLYQTTKLGKVGKHTYKGPDHLWIFMDKMTNKRAGDPGPWNIEPDFMPPANTYKVLIDCKENPIICELLEPDCDLLFSDTRPYTTEELPVNDQDGNPFLHMEPTNPSPDHTYEIEDIEFNPNGHDPKTGIGGTWVYPLPFKKPHVSWYSLKNTRWSKLSGSDHKIHDDLPAALKKEWEDYRKELRDIPITYGVAFSIAIDNAGTGYKVNDKFVVDKTVFGFKESDIGVADDINQPMGWRPGFDHADMDNVHEKEFHEADDDSVLTPGDNPSSPEGMLFEGRYGPLGLTEKPTLDVTIIVTEVDGDGAITGVRTRNAFCARHIFEAQTHADVANTPTTDAGTGAKFTLSKVVRWDPWKCRLPKAPDDIVAQWEGKRIKRYLTDEERDDPSDGFYMEHHTYHPVTGHFISPEKGGNYFAKDLKRLNLSTDGTAFDDGKADGLPAAPTDVNGKVRVVGTVKARKQS